MAAVRTIAFMAGASSAAQAWRYVTPYLPADVTPVYHDLLALGKPDVATYSWGHEVKALASALPSTGSAHLVGFSAGATLALAYTARWPDRVESLVLVEPAWPSSPWTRWRPSTTLGWRPSCVCRPPSRDPLLC